MLSLFLTTEANHHRQYCPSGGYYGNDYWARIANKDSQESISGSYVLEQSGRAVSRSIK